MSVDHDRARELLAGYALRALSGEDAADAEALLTEHVPGCAECRATLDAYRAVVGDLALAVPPRPAPEPLWARLSRDLDDGPVASGRRLPAWVGAAAAVVVLALAGWTGFLATRVSTLSADERLTRNALSTLADPGAEVVRMEPEARPAEGRAKLMMAYVPGSEPIYLVGADVPRPAPGRVYQIWLVESGRPVASAGVFVPRGGRVLLPLGFDPRAFDEIWITHEPFPGSPRPRGPPAAAAIV